MLETITLNDLEPYITGQLREAPTCGIEKLDRHLRMKRNLTIIGGVSSTGKTTAWLWILFTWSETLGCKWLLFTNENENAEIFLSLVEWRMRRDITTVLRKDIQDAIEWTRNHFQLLPTHYSTNLQAVLRRACLVQRDLFEFDGFFLDPYNSLKTSSYHEHYENAGRMREFVRFTGTKLCVSMHVLSEAQRTRDKDGNIKCPHIASLENGSMWFNRSDDAVVIHRQSQNPTRRYITEIHVQKIKHHRSGGSTTNIDTPIELTWEGSFGGFEWG